MEQPAGNRRIDRIRDPDYVRGLEDLPVEELRARRDECLAEREHLSLLRRLVQGRAEILSAELSARAEGGDETPIVDRLATILAGDDHEVTSRGEALRVGVADDEMLLARREVERSVSDAAISDPSALDEAQLEKVVDALLRHERDVSAARGEVLAVLDRLQDELKRRYKDDPTLALR